MPELKPGKLNLGSGGRPLEGFTNVDINPNAPKVDVVHDLNAYPWPFESNSIDGVIMDQCLEHLDDNNRAMEEIHRVLKPGGTAKITVPHFTWQFAYADPTHKHFFTHNTFTYYTNKTGYFNFVFSKCRSRIIFGKRFSFWNIILEPIFNLCPTVYEQSPLRIFPALKVEAILTK